MLLYIYFFCCFKTHRIAPKFSRGENRKAWLTVAGRWALANLVGGSTWRGPSLGEPFAQAVGQLFGKAERRGLCNWGTRAHTPPRAIETKEFTPYRAWSAAPDDSGGCWDKGRESPTAGNSRTYQTFCFLSELSQIWGELSQIFKPVTQPCQSKYSSCRSTRLGLCLRSSAQIRDWTCPAMDMGRKWEYTNYHRCGVNHHKWC